MRITERFEFSSTGTVSNGVVSFPTTGQYNTETSNTLLGLQIGTEYMFRHEKWHWGLRGKAAGLLNWAEGTRHVATSASADPFASIFPNYRVRDDENQISGVIEFGATTKYMITPTFWVHASYDLMWVTGIAMAPEQLRFDTVAVNETLNVGGATFYHGLTLGAEWTY
jgi:hypothetical protein